MSNLALSSTSSKMLERVTRIASIILGLIFLLSAWSHLQNEMAFYSAILQYGLLPLSFAGVASEILPFLQVVLAACFIFQYLVPAATRIGIGLLLVFTAAQIWIYVRGGTLHCGCFGAMNDEAVGISSIGRNAVFLVVLTYVAVSARNPCYDQVIDRIKSAE